MPSPVQSLAPDVGDTELGPVPGGWKLQPVEVGARTFELVLPADPDLFLSDPAVLEANRLDDYMPYWCYLWPAALEFAHELEHAPWPPGTEVLELGCGVGLVGLAALARGLHVTMSDYDPAAVACALENAARNGYRETADGLLLDWRSPPARQFPVILGCDLLYEARNHAPLLDLLESMLAPGGVCWLADPGRSHAAAFVRSAIDRGFRVSIRGSAGRLVGSPELGRFQIFVLDR